MGGTMRAVRFDRGRVVDSEDGGRPSTQAHGARDVHRVGDGVYLHRDDVVEWMRDAFYGTDGDFDDPVEVLVAAADFLKGAGLL